MDKLEIIFLVFNLFFIILFDMFHRYRYKWCKKKCKGKKCVSWPCKCYTECCSYRRQRQVLNTLHEIGFEFVVGDDKTAPVYIPKESFPVEFVFTKYKLLIDSMEALENLSKRNYTILVDKNYQTKD